MQETQVTTKTSETSINLEGRMEKNKGVEAWACKTAPTRLHSRTATENIDEDGTAFLQKNDI